MWRTFPCEECGAEIAVHFLKTGELARCRSCGAETPVPESTRKSEAPPDHVLDTTRHGDAGDHDPEEELAPLECPRCQTPQVDGSGHCPMCNLQFSQVSLYNPKHYVWLAIFLSFLVPVYLAASNWGRLGKENLRRVWLIGGMVAFSSLILALVLLDEHIPDDRIFARYLPYLVNLPIAIYLRQKQRPLFEAGKKLGVKGASLLKGTLAGTGIVAGLLVLVILPWALLSPDPMDSGLALMEEGRYSEAAVVFQELYEEYPDYPEILLSKAICHVECEQIEEAAATLTVYLEQRPSSAEGWLFLGSIRDYQGRAAEAERLYSIADSLEPGIAKEYLEDE